jgi:sugar phosphate isomerase/epimerase
MKKIKMLKDKLSHFYSFSRVADADIAPTLERFVAAGHSKVVVGCSWCERLLKDAAFAKFLKRAFEASGAVPQGSHAPFRDVPEVSVDSFTADADSRYVKKHIELLKMLPAEFGVTTYTLHVGWLPDGVTQQEYVERGIRALELLVPTAERNGVTIAVENAFSPISGVDALKKYVEHFEGSAGIGVCLDVGHANINYRTPGKTAEQLRLDRIQRMNDEFLFCDGHMEEHLLPHIVVAHLHDNDGLADEHNMPMTGNVDWTEIFGILARAPRLASVEDEASPRGMTPEEVSKLYDRLFAQYARDIYDMKKVS